MVSQICRANMLILVIIKMLVDLQNLDVRY